jgi:hypothetical protein
MRPTTRRDQGFPNSPEGNPSPGGRKSKAGRKELKGKSFHFLRRIKPYQGVAPTPLPISDFFFLGRFRPQRRDRSVGGAGSLRAVSSVLFVFVSVPPVS